MRTHTRRSVVGVVCALALFTVSAVQPNLPHLVHAEGDPVPGCPEQLADSHATKLRVGLVTDIGNGAATIDDMGFNQSAWEGVLCAQANLGADVAYIETTYPSTYRKNIEQLVQNNYDVIITVGFGAGDDTIAAAAQYPTTRFIGVDQFQPTVLANLAGLTFPEDQAGFLAGYLAGSLSKTGIVGQVLASPQVPLIEKYRTGFIGGANASRPGIRVLSACHPGGLVVTFRDRVWGSDTASNEMGLFADIIFAAGGATANGALLAVAERGGTVLGIGSEIDQSLVLPEASTILVSSAMKLVTPGVFNLVKSVTDDTFAGGTVEGQVGLAPQHDLAGRVPTAVQQKITQVTADLAAGRVVTGWTGPTGKCPHA